MKRLANRVKRLEDATFPLMPTIVMLQDGETLEDAMLRKEIPDMKDGYPTCNCSEFCMRGRLTPP